jgi:vacuolar-type H+-ATPase subunit H
MTKQLVEEIMALEDDAQRQIEHATKQREAAIQKAHERALKIVQDAEHTLDTEREAATKERTDKLRAQKQKTIEEAHAEAKKLASKLQPKAQGGTTFVLDKFKEYVENEIS